MKPLAENRKAKHDYAILETFEAGIALTGHEAKSVKAGHMQLVGGYALVRGGEVFLIGATISSFQPNNAPPEYDPSRTRRLLLRKEEIVKLVGPLNEKGMSLIPLRTYQRHNIVKIELCLARARKKHDKRELLKTREAKREMRGV